MKIHTQFATPTPDVEQFKEPLRVGIGGPVGSGKTALTLALCQRLRDVYNIAVVTNDIFTKEDADFLTRSPRARTHYWCRNGWLPTHSDT